MPTITDRYHFDMSDVNRLEILFGTKLPDLLEPLRLLDADLDALQSQLDEYRTLAHDVETLYTELAAARTSYIWQGDAASAAAGVWDVVLTALKWIAAIILFIVAILLLLVGALLVAIAAICELIATVLGFVAGVIAAIVVLVVLLRTRGAAGTIAKTWRALWVVFNTAFLSAMGIVQTVVGVVATVFDIAGRAIIWLSYYLIGVGTELTGEDATPIRRERDKLFPKHASPPHVRGR